MRRIANESVEVKGYFIDYLSKLISITCERISKLSRKTDKFDSICDMVNPR